MAETLADRVRAKSERFDSASRDPGGEVVLISVKMLDEIAAALDALTAERDALAEALKQIAIAPCISELLGEDDCEDSCPGCRARRALTPSTEPSNG